MTINLLHLASHFKEISAKFEHFPDSEGPRYAGNVAVRKFKENFETEGFFGKPWDNVRRRMSSYRDSQGKTHKVHLPKHDNKAATRKVLHGRTGNLKRSISSEVSGHAQATIYSDSKYGKRHNEGLDKMPKREFIGDNPQVENAVKTEIERRLNKIFNG
jgi:phage gpG-like protein